MILSLVWGWGTVAMKCFTPNKVQKRCQILACKCYFAVNEVIGRNVVEHAPVLEKQMWYVFYCCFRWSFAPVKYKVLVRGDSDYLDIFPQRLKGI